MPARRTFRGIANHQAGDFIWVSQWVGHPTDLFTGLDYKKTDEWISKTFAGSFGGILGLPEILLDTDLWVGKPCAKWGEHCGDLEDECKFRRGEICRPPRVMFTATVDIERIEDGQGQTVYH